MHKKSALDPLDHQRLRLLFQQGKVASLISGLGGIVCVTVFMRSAPSTIALVWLGFLLFATALRFWVYRQFFDTDVKRYPASHWLRLHGSTAAIVGVTWGCLPLIPLGDSSVHVKELQIMVPGFVLMSAISSYAIYLRQYLILWATTGGGAMLSYAAMHGAAGIPGVLLIALFMPVLLLTAKRYSASLNTSLEKTLELEKMFGEVTETNSALQQKNSLMAQQQDLLEQEEALAQHVFTQLTLGGDHKVPGIHSWNQPMGALSGDLIHTARGPNGQAYVLLADFTGHGLPAALGALPASSVFLAMAAKGLPVETIACELNNKLNQLLPVGYFCCAVLLELSADRRKIHVWNGGLPPVLMKRKGQQDFERIPSHALPLGVIGEHEFEAEAQHLDFAPGDVLYAYTDGLTEAENIDGEMWGLERLEKFLLNKKIEAPKLPPLIDAVLEHVNLAPASDDVSVLEVEATPSDMEAVDAA